MEGRAAATDAGAAAVATLWPTVAAPVRTAVEPEVAAAAGTAAAVRTTAVRSAPAKGRLKRIMRVNMSSYR
ncbi:hypothetical protein Misp01_61240 [Microtetraspora sp. NBRC 13810]|nr:hypothetical protein Misp01_61240 [Microtetraspora sp. NBRC 13810]